MDLTPRVRKRGDFVEAFLFTRDGECLLAGRSVASASLADLRHYAWWLVGVGAGVLALGLLGGGWIAGRTIQPLEEISATAGRIAAGHLSHRIDIPEADNEIGRLARALNAAFSRLQTAFTQQGRFATDAAQELRAPVALILTQAQAALSRERTSVEFRKTVEACERAAQRMRQLIDTLLELARIETGQDSMKRFKFDLAGVARECVERVRPLAEERKVTIHTDLLGMDCEGDPKHIAQAVTQLLTYAIELNQGGGDVRISGQHRAGQIFCCIAAGGPTIPAAVLEHIFERFSPAEISPAKYTGRTGLELALAQAIITAQGGRLEAVSQDGVGTAFSIYLPAGVVGEKSR